MVSCYYDYYMRADFFFFCLVERESCRELLAWNRTSQAQALGAIVAYGVHMILVLDVSRSVVVSTAPKKIFPYCSYL